MYTLREVLFGRETQGQAEGRLQQEQQTLRKYQTTATFQTHRPSLQFRLNGKANSVPWVTIFAVGYAVRVNYDLPENIQKRHKFFKRDIHSELLDVPHESARSGISCIVKHLCETVQEIRSSEGCGFFCEIGRIISRWAEGSREALLDVLLSGPKGRSPTFSRPSSKNATTTSATAPTISKYRRTPF